MRNLHRRHVSHCLTVFLQQGRTNPVWTVHGIVSKIGLPHSGLTTRVRGYQRQEDHSMRPMAESVLCIHYSAITL